MIKKAPVITSKILNMSGQILMNGHGYSNGDKCLSETITSTIDATGTRVKLVDEDDVNFFEHQVSGHGTLEKGLLKHKLGYIMKPLQKPPMGIREANFYQQVFDPNPEKEEWLQKLSDFIPIFHGVASINSKNSNGVINGDTSSSQPTKYLVLEDIIETFKNPSVVDIKIGSQTWSPDAPEAKRKHEMSKYKGTKYPVGLSLTGMHYFDTVKMEKCKKSKEFCKSLCPATLKVALQQFFNNENDANSSSSSSSPPPPRSNILVRSTLHKLQKLHEIFSVQTKLRFYGSSILVAYDADYLIGESYENDDKVPLRVYMIDFAHVHPSEDCDDDGTVDKNYLFGLSNFIKIMCDIADSSDTESVKK